MFTEKEAYLISERLRKPDLFDLKKGVDSVNNVNHFKSKTNNNDVVNH